jgi:ClpP class serine protease
MTHHPSALVALIRSQLWAIDPVWLDGIEAIALRAFEAGSLEALRSDGHAESMAATLGAVAAVGDRLPGSSFSTARDGAAVVPLFGVIAPRASLLDSSAGGTALDGFMRDLRVAQASQAIERIVMVVDSPGGTVSGLAEAAEAIRASAKPITAFVTGQAASAAYWLASSASRIVAERAAVVGNIGVVISQSRQVGPDQSGRIVREVVSSGAPNKRPDADTEEGRAALQAMVDAAEAVFVADVAKGRGVTPATVRNEYGRGAMLIASDALKAGMIDEIGTLEGVLARNTRRAGSTTPGRSRALAAAQLDMRRLAARGE